ncbi:3056_t:CDS:2 [Ambispora leptoticha]|uniref:3056_t:CDS:1 n=1 Tax=Ambispora leptoticha TaxID=144679 RepID=A0A9N9CL00_9GLOM|nr:3056_t:CDS:2 [Ambispora leptoticha]
MVAHHDNIIRFFGITQDPNTEKYYLVLQFANNSDLRDYLRNKFSELDWETEISGINCLHNANIVHRDLHDKNILVQVRKLMITDFGISKSVEITPNLFLLLIVIVSSGLPPFRDKSNLENNVLINYYNDLINYKPLVRNHNSYRGVIYSIMSRYEESLVDLDKSLEIDPINTSALAIRGITYHITSKHEESLADLNKSLEIDPNYVSALEQRAWRMMNSYEESLADLNKSLEIRPDNARALDKYEELLTDLNKSLKLIQIMKTH